MVFTVAELDYLASQRLGRLATVGPDGAPQNNPVGFSVNAEDGTIDIGGRQLGARAGSSAMSKRTAMWPLSSTICLGQSVAGARHRDTRSGRGADRPASDKRLLQRRDHPHPSAPQLQLGHRSGQSGSAPPRCHGRRGLTDASASAACTAAVMVAPATSSGSVLRRARLRTNAPTRRATIPVALIASPSNRRQ